jgi:hypothetical protein
MVRCAKYVAKWDTELGNRYKTEGEKSGTKRRMSTWRSRQRNIGRKPHEIWVTDEEFAKMKEFLEAFRLKNKAAAPPAATGDAA